MNNRHRAPIEQVRDRLLEGEGTLPSAIRRAAAGLGEGLPPEARKLVEKISRHAYKVVPEDFEQLKQSGWSEDQLFELVLCASLGAGLARLAAAERAIAGGEPCTLPSSKPATG